jgi:hypothetical protein
MDDLRWYDGRSGDGRRRKIEVCVDVRYTSEVYILMIESGCFQPPCKRCIICFFAMRLESGLLSKDSGVECGRKLPNRLPNFCLICAGNCLIACLIVCLIFPLQSRLFYIGDTLRDRPATPELGTFVPNGRRHGAALALAGAPAKIASQIRQRIRQRIRQFPAQN